MSCFNFHSEEETERAKAPDKQFVYPHDGSKRSCADDSVLPGDAHVPLDNVEADGDDNCLMQHIEWQYGLVSVAEETPVVGHVAASQPNYGHYP